MHLKEENDDSLLIKESKKLKKKNYDNHND
jgi:hypothetical protein